MSGRQSYMAFFGPQGLPEGLHVRGSGLANLSPCMICRTRRHFFAACQFRLRRVASPPKVLEAIGVPSEPPPRGNRLKGRSWPKEAPARRQAPCSHEPSIAATPVLAILKPPSVRPFRARRQPRFRGNALCSRAYPDFVNWEGWASVTICFHLHRPQKVGTTARVVGAAVAVAAILGGGCCGRAIFSRCSNSFWSASGSV